MLIRSKVTVQYVCAGQVTSAAHDAAYSIRMVRYGGDLRSSAIIDSLQDSTRLPPAKEATSSCSFLNLGHVHLPR
jgi:hypothetical protein